MVLHTLQPSSRPPRSSRGRLGVRRRVSQPAADGSVIIGLAIWDLLDHLPLSLGVAGLEGSTIIVGLNGLRLLRTHAWRR